ncbi:MAG: Zn-ribbon domain-containing OB-fold protein [Alphaproteobacteria bacterium]|nr:Zn-ribbon domain-containing OB-fold protein [Alphaproteobacteria bacterium]
MSEHEPVTRFRAPVSLDYVVRAGDVTGAFLEGILDGRLVGRRCPDCRKVYVPARSICPTCSVPTTDEVEVGPRGTVTSLSVVRFPFEGQRLEPPYACVHIRLDGADSPLLHIVGECDVDRVRMGMRVEPVWDPEPLPSLERVRYSRPSGEPDVALEEG